MLYISVDLDMCIYTCLNMRYWTHRESRKAMESCRVVQRSERQEQLSFQRRHDSRPGCHPAWVDPRLKPSTGFIWEFPIIGGPNVDPKIVGLLL